MPKRADVDQHPKRKQIIKDLVAGRTYREIKEKYGVAQAALSRYLRGKLMPRAAKAELQRQLGDGRTVLDEIDKVMSRVKKMYDACDEYLQDPENQDRYYLGPRAQEIDVIYYAKDEETGKVQARKADLQALVDPYFVQEIRYRHADPRRLLLETARTLNTQLELLAKIHGQIKDVTINIINTPVWIQLQQIILNATKEQPEVRKQIADALNALAESGGGSTSGILPT